MDFSDRLNSPPSGFATWVRCSAKWRTYVPCDDHIAQRGGTYLLDEEGALLYERRETHLLGFADDMAAPLAFLNPYLNGDPS